MQKNETKLFSKQWLCELITIKIGKGKCIFEICMRELSCGQNEFGQLWSTLEDKIHPRGLKKLNIEETPRLAGGFVMSALVNSRIH